MSACKNRRNSIRTSSKPRARSGTSSPYHAFKFHANAARALYLADTSPTALRRSATSAPPEWPGCTGALI